LIGAEKIYKALFNPKEMQVGFEEPPKLIGFSSGKEPQRYLYGGVHQGPQPEGNRVAFVNPPVNKRPKVKIPVVVEQMDPHGGSLKITGVTRMGSVGGDEFGKKRND
jgi:hypothetical protein